MPNPDGSLTPEEYAAQIQASLTGPLLPGLPNPPPAPVPQVTAPLSIADQAAQSSAMAKAANVASGATPPPGPPQGQVEEVDPMLGVVSRPLPAPPTAPPAAPAAGVPSFYGQAGQNAPSEAPGAPGAPPLMPPFPGIGMPNAVANAKAQGSAVEEEGKARAAAAAGRAAALEKQNAEAMEQADYQAKARADLLKTADDLMADIKANKIDPNRLWASKSSGEQASALIGIVLGGIGAGMTKGPNMALEVINRAIDRDINAQTANLDTQKGLLSALMQKYGNLTQAQEVARGILKDRFTRQLEEQAAASGGPVEQAHAKALGAAIMAPVAMKLDEISAQRGMAAWQFAAQQRLYDQALRGGGGGGGAPKVIPSDFQMPPPAMGDPAAVQKMVEASNQHKIPGPIPGTVTYARTPGDAEKAKGRLAGVENLETTLERMDALARDGVTTPGEKKATYDRLRTVAAGEFARMQGLSPGGETLKEFEQIFPSGWEQFYGSNRMAAARDSIYSAKRSIYSAHAGMDPRYIPVPTRGP